MARTEMMTVSMRELHRLKTIQAVVDGLLPMRTAAERLSITDRQVRRLVCRYQAEGSMGLISRHRGRPSNHQLASGIAEQAVILACLRAFSTLSTVSYSSLSASYACLNAEFFNS